MPIINHADVLQTRKTRVVCISDTHNSSPKDGGWKLPKGDVLIHAGDFTNQGTFSEIQKTVKWIEDADFEAKIVIAGNHELTLDRRFYAQNGHNFHNQEPQDAAACEALLTNSPSITYLNHASSHIRLTSSSGPQTQFSVFGSPHVPSRGHWAFGYDSVADALRLWGDIPQETDIVVAHTPPKGLCDNSPKWGPSAGCAELRNTIERVRPRLVVCGHVHEGRGAMRLKWSRIFDGGVMQQEEIDLNYAQRTKKQCVVDLTGKAYARPSNVWGHEEMIASSHLTPDVCAKACSSTIPATAEQRFVASGNLSPIRHVVSTSEMLQPEADLPFALNPSLKKKDAEELGHLTGRNDTCIINAAILATSYGVKPKRFNKPIIVDIDLPVRDDDRR
ncbi:MAG: hypothetical protein Q9165_007689 [Trypethelium subeluteriae]